jgi:type 1 fimbria pilin
MDGWLVEVALGTCATFRTEVAMGKIYTDEVRISGTSTKKRTDFKLMLEDCKSGKVTYFYL